MTKRACQAANPDNCRWPEHQRQHNASRVLAKAYEERTTAEKKGLAGVSEYMVAKYRLTEAEAEFNSTDEGIDKLQEIIRKAEANKDYKESDHFKALLQKALLRADEYDTYDAKTPEELAQKKAESRSIDNSKETTESFRQKAVAKVSADRIAKDAESLTEDSKEDREFNNRSLIHRFLTQIEYEDLSLDSITLAKEREDEYKVLVLVNEEEQRKDDAWSNGKILRDEVLNELDFNASSRISAQKALELGIIEQSQLRLAKSRARSAGMNASDEFFEYGSMEQINARLVRDKEAKAQQMRLTPPKKNKSMSDRIQAMFKNPRK